MWYRILVAAVFSLASSSHTLANQLMLNGLAPYQYLSKTFYLASFYAEQPITSTGQFTAYTGAKRMVIKVSADTWSPRQFNQMWKQDIALNNTLRDNPAVIELISTFTETPSEDFTRGDTIVIDYAPGQGTRITMNNADWLQSGDEVLFRTLANAWLGDIPTSQRFQEALLAGGTFADRQAHTQWVSLNDTLTVAPDRLNLLASFSGETVAARREAERLAVEAAERQAALAAQAEQDAQRQSEAARLAEAREQARQLAEARARAEAEAAELARARALASAEAQALEQARAQADAERQAREAANARAEAERLERLNDLTEAERQARLQAYQARLQKQILSQVEYPYWAENLGQEGLVAMRLSITADGRVQRMEFTERSRHAVLNKALEDAITQASPLETMPPELDLPTTDLTVQHEFAIN